MIFVFSFLMISREFDELFNDGRREKEKVYFHYFTHQKKNPAMSLDPFARFECKLITSTENANEQIHAPYAFTYVIYDTKLEKVIDHYKN